MTTIPSKEEALRCPLCSRKLPVSRLEGEVWVYCRHCKQTLRLDSKVFVVD